MDEELSIINTKTRNEKIKNFFINNKNKLIFGIVILLVGIVGVYSFDKYQIEYFKRIKKLNLSNPLLIGFGISNKKTFQAACQNSNGAIIGSAYIKYIEIMVYPKPEILLS